MPPSPGPDALLSEEPDDLGPAPEGEPPEDERPWWRRWSSRARRSSSGDDDGGCDTDDCDCDGCDCDPGCNLMRLSTALLVVAAVHPPGPPGRAAALGALRLYRHRLSRFTRPCPATPSCSAYAEAAVSRLGARRGLVAAARRVGGCSSGGHP